MGKIILKKSQYTRLRGSLLEMTMRSYIFDWDDNILYMPTTIKMDKKNGDKWVPLDVSTDDFVKVRNDKNYRLRDNNAELAFIDFRLSKPFIEDVKKAIHQNKFAPSADKFKEALINSRTFAINTARGHKPNTLKEGVKIFIDMVLTKEEKSKMLENIRKTLKLSEGLNDEQSIDLFLDEMGEYYPVSSEEFGDRFNLDVYGSASSPEQAKKVAIEHFTKKIFDNVKKLVGSEYKKFSIGFSDDDLGNVMAVEQFIEEELSVMYPEINFVVYDTSDKGNRKMVIEKE
jgi:hypothetical protein